MSRIVLTVGDAHISISKGRVCSTVSEDETVRLVWHQLDHLRAAREALGVDDDDMICEESHPPLSSIVLAGDVVGYEAWPVRPI